MFEVCKPDARRAKGLHAGGCLWPETCILNGKCYYGVGETFSLAGVDKRRRAVGLDMEERPRLAKRPVAFRIVHPDGRVELSLDEEAADFIGEATGAKIQGLYVRDGT